MGNNKSFKLRIRFELAYEIIIVSFLIILVGLAFLFASNLLILNWFSVIFSLLAILLLFLKISSYLTVENDVLSLIYFKGLKKQKIQMITIDEFVFYERSKLVEIKSNNQVISNVYLTNKNKQKLLNYVVNDYPEIPCLFLNKTN